MKSGVVRLCKRTVPVGVSCFCDIEVGDSVWRRDQLAATRKCYREHGPRAVRLAIQLMRRLRAGGTVMMAPVCPGLSIVGTVGAYIMCV